VHHAQLWCVLGGVSSKCLFTEDMDDGVPERLKSNHRINMDHRVLKNNEFMSVKLESDSHQGVGAHSFRKGTANEARKAGALPDEIEIQGWWKPQGWRVAFRLIDVTQVHIDAMICRMLCQGGALGTSQRQVLQILSLVIGSS